MPDTMARAALRNNSPTYARFRHRTVRQKLDLAVRAVVVVVAVMVILYDKTHWTPPYPRHGASVSTPDLRQAPR